MICMSSCLDSGPLWVHVRANIWKHARAEMDSREQADIDMESQAISARVTKQIVTILGKACDNALKYK